MFESLFLLSPHLCQFALDEQDVNTGAVILLKPFKKFAAIYTGINPE